MFSGIFLASPGKAGLRTSGHLVWTASLLQSDHVRYDPDKTLEFGVMGLFALGSQAMQRPSDPQRWSVQYWSYRSRSRNLPDTAPPSESHQPRLTLQRPRSARPRCGHDCSRTLRKVDELEFGLEQLEHGHVTPTCLGAASLHIASVSEHYVYRREPCQAHCHPHRPPTLADADRAHPADKQQHWERGRAKLGGITARRLDAARFLERAQLRHRRRGHDRLGGGSGAPPSADQARRHEQPLSRGRRDRVGWSVADAAGVGDPAVRAEHDRRRWAASGAERAGCLPQPQDAPPADGRGRRRVHSGRGAGCDGVAACWLFRASVRAELDAHVRAAAEGEAGRCGLHVGGAGVAGAQGVALGVLRTGMAAWGRL
mmetsp:Transcript_7075/g.16526  ORF Transcript_7075/g.16526 Transcript_7075/m.16526 type:complete len:371 (-) Transcript_7075:415-1527(-)